VNEETVRGCVETNVSVTDTLSVPAYVAVICTVCVDPTAIDPILNVALEAPAGTVNCCTGPFMVLTEGRTTLWLDALSVTRMPPVGAVSLRVSVAVVDWPPLMVVGFTVSVFSTVVELELEDDPDDELDDAVELLWHAAKPASERHSRLPIKKRLTRTIHSPKGWSPQTFKL